MVQESSNSGFTLPDPNVAGEEVVIEQASLQGYEAQPVAETHVRDMTLGIGILLVLAVVFFFIKGAFSLSLVRKRFSPANANAAAWWLYGFLITTAAATLVMVLYPTLFSWPVLVVFPLLTLVMTVRASRPPHCK